MVRVEQQTGVENNPTSPEFFRAIRRPELGKTITPQKPWVYSSLEVYGQELGGSGGLGILAEDTRLQAEYLGLPFLVLTNFYPKRLEQKLTPDFLQREKERYIIPEDVGFEKLRSLQIRVNG